MSNSNIAGANFDGCLEAVDEVDMAFSSWKFERTGGVVAFFPLAHAACPRASLKVVCNGPFFWACALLEEKDGRGGAFGRAVDRAHRAEHIKKLDRSLRLP
ncbi:hypothetical protein [Caballeronia glebae]|uniref:hypothetical protein n=1 Tax=Caballeronia glebae TaxID=1777143 RepID=UPI0038B96809